MPAHILSRTGPGISTARIAVGALVAASLVGGCTGPHARPASASLQGRAMDKVQAKGDKAIARAELAVAQAPQAVAARTALGRAYLAGGRFDSAATALGDAMTLGDSSGSTALALALAHIGQGRFQAAVEVLETARSELPAGDLGLALALSGESSRAVAVLTDALRRGENTPKLRQNLAYAFALDGRWAEARVMAAQDVPADQLDRRLAVWALSTLPDRNSERMAALLGVPVRHDPGQPAALALRSEGARPQLAVDTAPAAPAAADEGPVAAELPSLAVAALPQSIVADNLVAQTAPALLPAPAPVAAPTPRRSVAQAFGTAAPAAKPAVSPRVPTPARAAADGRTHFVQLGSFSSEQGARRAWGIYTRQNPSLAAYPMTITPAVVHGKAVWRVAAGGLGSGHAAGGLCSAVKARGGACFAYAAPVKVAPAPVFQPHAVRSQMARRR